MSDSMRLTDDQITSMLLERVASPMPPDLSAAVLASVRAAHRQDRRLGRGTLRPGTLLVAATLLIGEQPPGCRLRGVKADRAASAHAGTCLGHDQGGAGLAH